MAPVFGAAVDAPVQVRVPVWVEGGEPLKFTARLDGAPVPVVETRAPASDQVILIVLDLTGDLAKADAAREAVSRQISELRDNVWTGLLRAQDGLSVLLDPSDDRIKLNQTFETVPIAGKSGLLDTIQEVGGIADAMARKAPVRTAVLYITDSNIYNYRQDYTNPVINSSDPHDLSRRFSDELIRGRVSRMSEELAAQETPTFIVHLNYRYDRLNVAYQNGLKMLAETTGGAAIFCRSTEEIDDGIGRAFAAMRSAWYMTLALPKKTPSTVQLHLTATAAGGAEVRLQYRTRFAVRRK